MTRAKERIFERAGLGIARSTLATWVGACGVQLQPAGRCAAARAARARRTARRRDAAGDARPRAGKTHRAYLWSYCTTSYAATQAVVFDFADSRAGRHAQEFLGAWHGKLVCDDYGGYKALFAAGITEAGCLAHARRKFYDLWANHKEPDRRDCAGAVRQALRSRAHGARPRRR